MRLSNIVNRTNNLRKVNDVSDPIALALKLKRRKLPTIHFIEHHPSHLAGASFVSPFNRAAICADRGFGDFVSTSTGEGRGNRRTRIR